MATYDLEEQEQLAELKTWWQQYGNRVTSIVLALALGVAAWQGWHWWQQQQSLQASVVYSGLQQAAGQKDARRVKELAGELIEKYSGTSYAGMGALIAARVQVDQGDLKNARVQLAWAADHANDAGLRALARLRLATVLLDEKAYDEALKQLAVEPAAPFAARYADVRGDIYVAQGKPAEAVKSYDDALAKIDAAAKAGEVSRHKAYRELVQTKRDALEATQ
ncbi:YfgM family protein [Rugosibacter aromaticivorans]|nr:tetratricopeptide repeat protein [Rugosibacter aromaticivorans]